MMWRMSRGNLKCVFVSVLLLWLFIFVCQCMFVRLCAVILVGIGKIGLKSNGRPSHMCFCPFECLSVCVIVFVLCFVCVCVDKGGGWEKMGWRVRRAIAFLCMCMWVFLLFVYQRMCVMIKVVVEKKWVEEWGEAIYGRAELRLVARYGAEHEEVRNTHLLMRKTNGREDDTNYKE